MLRSVRDSRQTASARTRSSDWLEVRYVRFNFAPFFFYSIVFRAKGPDRPKTRKEGTEEDIEVSCVRGGGGLGRFSGPCF